MLPLLPGWPWCNQGEASFKLIEQTAQLCKRHRVSLYGHSAGFEQFWCRRESQHQSFEIQRGYAKRRRRRWVLLVGERIEY